MVRSRNTTSSGHGFSDKVIESVWEKGKSASQPGFKKDICGTLIKQDKYGKTEEYGWEIDHIKPVAKGGTDDLTNLQPLFWDTNRKKADTYPWKC
jgi:hypothetical protein